jgi:hypothetical protein
MATTVQDPREIITPDAFSVAPELLGMPLARPWRRAVAMSVDLLAIAILGSAGWFFLGLGFALFLFRAATRPAEDALGKGARLAMFGSLGAVILAVTLAGGWRNWLSGDESPVSVDAGGVVSALGLGDVSGFASDVITLTRTDSESEMREAATRFAERLNGRGVAPAEIREALEQFAAERDAPWALDAVHAGLAAANIGAVEAESMPADADSLAIAYAAALQSGDSALIARLRGAAGEALAADRLARLQRRIESVQAENTRLEDDLEGEQERGLIRTMFRLADEVGIGFGWAGLYFTVFLAFWGGRTPGKRLVRIRVLRLDGKPIGLWVAFNRFGGYAASIFTGLLGFFEMFWDRNRQALHDRIASTVVVRE